MRIRHWFSLLAFAALPAIAQDAQQAQPAQSTPPAAAPAAPAPAAPDNLITGSVEVGYRWIPSLNGNNDVYRSTVDLNEGLRLINLDLSVQPVKRLFDRFEVQANSWGDPYNTLRIDVEKNGAYNFTADYSNTAFFNFLPSFANPGLSAGSLLTESSYNSQIRNADAELDLLPGHWFSPYVAWSTNSWNGTGLTDFTLPPNNYPVFTSISDRTMNFRGGVQLETKLFHVVLEQGGTTFKDDQGASQNQLSNGDFPVLYLGEQLNLSALSELYRVRGDSIYTKALIASDPLPWLSVSGQFLYSQPNLTTNYSAFTQGNLFLPDAFAFFSSGQDIATADAQMPHTTASFTADARPTRRLRIVENWMTDRLHDASSSLLAEQYLMAGSSPFVAGNPGTDRLVLNDNRQEVDVYYDLLPNLTLRGGERYEWGDATVRTTPLSEAPLESATLSRNTGLAGISYHLKQQLRLSGDFEAASTNHAFFDTSLWNYWKVRARAQWDFLTSFRLSGDFFELHNSNPDPQVNLTFLSRATSASLAWRPHDGHNISVLLDYTRSNINSNVFYLIPQTLSPADSIYLENGNTATALIDLAPRAMHGVAPRLSFGGSLFTSAGSRPTNYYQPMARLSIPLVHGIAWNSEWRWYSLSEQIYAFENFRSNQILVSLKYTR